MKKINLSSFTFLFVFSSYFTKGVSNEYGNLTRPTESSCARYQFRCDNGKCIDELRKCDLFDDCGDSSDENLCSHSFCDKHTQFKCKSGECISREMVCDGSVDCFHDEDEEHCGEDEDCPITKHRCAEGRCIPARWKCDGVKDCKEGSDERNCSNACQSGYAQCKNGECIPSEFFCDGKADCDEGDDESNCGNLEKLCLFNHGLYLCLDKSKCIKKEWVCDAKAHCNDNSDEGGMCGTFCKHLQPACSQECFRTPLGPKCKCRDGYKLLSDNVTCEDINECEYEVQVCDHFCKNVDGNFSCSCEKNYYLLEDDRASCRIKDPAIMLFSVGNDIVAKVMDGSSSWIVSSSEDSEKPSAVAFDPTFDMVYWIANKEKIFMKPLRNAAESKLFLHQGLTYPENLAVDWFGRNIYISDYKKFHILVCNLESGDCLVVLKNVNQPRALQLDLQEKHLYFTAMQSQTIERSGLDGTDRRVFVQENIVWPNGLALDLPAKRIYWVDANLDKIDSCNYHGQDRKSFPNKDASHAYSLAVWQDRIYWTDWQKMLQTEIHSCRKRDGRFWKSEYKDEKRAVGNIMIYHSSMFEDVHNPCDSNYEQKCSHICLLSRSNTAGYVCACPQDMKLDANGHECLGTGITPLVAIQSNIYNVPMRDYGTNNMRLKPYAKLQGVAVDIDYNPLKDEVYFADPTNEALSVVSLENGKVKTVIGNIRFPISVAIDWLRDNLYWINGVHHTVEVSRTSGSFRQTINDRIQTPTDLALDVIKGYLYISDASFISSIIKCEINGTNCRPIVQSNIKKASSVCVDFTTTTRNIYWTDSEKETIESIDEFGENRKIHFIDLAHPVKVYVDNKYIIWTQKNTAEVYYASKDVRESIRSTRMDLVNKPTDSWLMALTVINKNVNYTTNPCLGTTRKCHHFCFSRTEKDMVCGCSNGLTLEEDRSTCSPKKCESDQKMCRNKECIPLLLWCDGSVDCTDGSDEKNCSMTKKCSKDQFQCGNGRCFNIEYKCDGFNDCFDGSDEKNCTNTTCTVANSWQCDSGECLPQAWRCDHKVHCVDESDEKNCDKVVCTKDKKKCENGWCIPIRWWCDGQTDCKTGEDEKQCPCKLGEYKCKDGHCLDEAKLCSGEVSCDNEKLNLTCSKKELKQNYEGCPINFLPCNETNPNSTCIPFQAWCNKTIECPNKEDEKHCQCDEEDQVKCREEDVCIFRAWVCDGEKDCYLGSDEDECSPHEFYSNSTILEVTTICSAEEFTCTDGSCIPLDKVCDRSRDCVDGVDEYGDCDNCKNNNGGCQHICHSNPLKTWCSCKEGFMLSKDLHSCEDIDECLNEETCQQYCHNIKGSYICSCEEEYTLKEDEISCKPSNDIHWSLAVISNRKLDLFDEYLKTYGSRRIFPSYFGDNPNYFYDPVNKRLFGINGERGEIYMESSGSWVKEVSSLNNIQAVSFDYVNRNIYIVRANVVYRKLTRENKYESKTLGSTIQVYNLRNKHLGELVTVPDKNISSLELTLLFRDMITCENEESKGGIGSKGSIVSRYLDGSNLNVLVDEKILFCSSLAIDEFKKRVYWVDAVLNKIESVDFLGYDRKRFMSRQIYGPKSLSFLSHNLVWYNAHHHAIVKCSIRNPNDCQEQYLRREEDVAIINTEKIYHTGITSPCDNTTCAHICVPHILDVPHCICAIGYKSEREKCIPIDSSMSEKILGSCTNNPCKFGVCESITQDLLTCRCYKGYEGKLCEISLRGESMSKTGLILGLLTTFIIIGCIVALVYFYMKKSCPILSKERAKKLRFVQPSFVLIEEDSLSQPPTPPIRRSGNTALQKQASQNSNDSAIAIDLP